ncbi:MAG: PepSY-like domain-containing protein [Alistipes sp.]|nr:PepSY-like domain-containing protein [Alistipes sp.]
MKKLSLLTVLGLLLFTPVMADEYLTISERELPRAARELLMLHFPDQSVSRILIDRERFDHDYKIYLADGTSIECDKQGLWQEIHCKGRAVPSELIPGAIRHSVEERFAARPIVKIERDRHGYEIELEGGIDLEYSHRGRLLEIDN